MSNNLKKITAALLLILITAALFTGCITFEFPTDDLIEVTSAPADIFGVSPTKAAVDTRTESPSDGTTECPVSENGKYDSKDEVALYILLFGHLPSNYLRKNDAKNLGWTGGSLEP